MNAVVIGMTLPWLAVSFGCWLGYQLLRQNRRILRDLKALQQGIGEPGAAPLPAPPVPAPAGNGHPELFGAGTAPGEPAVHRCRCGKQVVAAGP